MIDFDTLPFTTKFINCPEPGCRLGIIRRYAAGGIMVTSTCPTCEGRGCIPDPPPLPPDTNQEAA